MFLNITSLNSGSNGNCYYIGNDKEAVLIDAGISCRETEKRMKLLGLSMNLVKAVFISHEHSDHIKGVPAIAQRFSLPVYITQKTLAGCCDIDRERTKCFTAYEPVTLGGISVTAFPKFHDAEDPHSFIVSYNNINIGIFTDIGISCDHVITNFKKCNAAFLEANYDEALLENGTYPYFLKKRITGGRGHLSNNQALEIFNKHRPSFMSHLLLSHLSKDNNCPEKAKKLFELHAGNTTIVVASRYEQTPLFKITAAQEVMFLVKEIKLVPKQMSLF